MRLSFILLLLTLPAMFADTSEQPTTTARPLDLKNKADFVTNFKNIWHTIFTQAKIVRWEAYENELEPLITESLSFQPCHTVVRKKPYGKPYFLKKHVLGMKKSITELTSLTAKMLPMEKGSDGNRFQFKVTATYVSYTGHFHTIVMVIEAFREKSEDPFHIHDIVETCPSAD